VEFKPIRSPGCKLTSEFGFLKKGILQVKDIALSSLIAVKSIQPTTFSITPLRSSPRKRGGNQIAQNKERAHSTLGGYSPGGRVPPVTPPPAGRLIRESRVSGLHAVYRVAEAA
jgi:hypothetical protein